MGIQMIIEIGSFRSGILDMKTFKGLSIGQQPINYSNLILTNYKEIQMLEIENSLNFNFKMNILFNSFSINTNPK
jgi:hypothetical protein